MDLKNFRKVIMLPMITGNFYYIFSVDKLKFNFLLLSYGLLLRVLYCVLCSLYMFISRNESQESNKDKLNYNSKFFNTFLLFLSSITSYISVTLNIKQFSCAINISSKVDKQFSKHGIVKLHGLIWVFHLLNLFFSVAPLIVGSFSFQAQIWHRLIMLLSTLFLFTSFYMSVYPFMMMVDRVKYQFRALRGFLEVTTPRTQMGPKLVLAVRLHSLLCQTCKHLNNCFNLQLLQLYLIIFSIVVTNSYYFIGAIETNETCLILFARITIILFHIGTGYLVIYLSKEVSLEAKEFNTMLYQLMLDDKINEISTNIKLRLHLSMKREVVFTACGFFTLDNTLIQSMIAAVATYIVIFVQFGQAASNPQ